MADHLIVWDNNTASFVIDPEYAKIELQEHIPLPTFKVTTQNDRTHTIRLKKPKD